MKTTKKLLVLCLIAVMGVVAVMPSTFSWYAHNGEVRNTGNAIRLFDASGLSDSSNDSAVNAANDPMELPLSLKQQSNSTVSMTTKAADDYGKTSGSNLSAFGSTCVGANSVNHYVTTFSNSGSKDVYIDFDITNITNSTKTFVGIKDPVVNEKCYASRANAPKTTYDKMRIYFEAREQDTGWNWWDVTFNNNTSNPNTYPNSGFNDDSWCDMNIQYYSDSEAEHKQSYMIYNGTSSGYYDDGANHDKVYKVNYQDIDASSNYIFFFNHYYLSSGSYKPNQTPNYTPAKHTVYYLNGGTYSGGDDDGKRTCSSYSDNELISVNSCYKSATMAAGKTANIGLVSVADNSEEYDYTGKSISYAVTEVKTPEGETVTETNRKNYVTVSNDGLITAKQACTATVTTTITGKYNDTLTLQTAVSVPASISQVPVAQNLKVPKNGTTSVHWYVKNTDSAPAGFESVFCTL